MYSIDFAAGLAPGDVWNWYSARRALREARGELDDACQQLSGLIAQNQWASEGMRALNAFMQDVAAGARGEAEQVQLHLDELERLQAG